MLVPRAIVNQSEIAQLVSSAEIELQRDVVSIQSDLGTDWSGDYALFFGVVLRDAASRGKRLEEVTARVRQALRDRLGPVTQDLLMYFSFRSRSEQAASGKEAWWM